jgi:ubiquinone/menaquinone biosynthesis C-methylase UbiE
MTTSFDPIWEQIHSTHEWGKYPPEHVIRWVARTWYKVPDRRQVKLLDVGAGQGACTWYMAREGFSVAALECAPAIERLNGRLAAEGLAADARVGDAVKLPWPDNSFDGVLDNFCLGTLPFTESVRAWDEMFRVLKPGGRVLSTGFTDRTYGYGLGREVEPGGFVDIRDGSLAGRGFNLFRGRQQIDQLFRKFDETKVETISWTAEEMRQVYEAWVVTARKPPAGR